MSPAFIIQKEGPFRPSLSYFLSLLCTKGLTEYQFGRPENSGGIALTPAVELSYLTEEQQHSLLGTIEVEDRTPSLSQAVRFKKLSQAGQLTDELIDSIMQEEKANQREMFRIPMERLQKALPDLKSSQVEDFIINAIIYYQKHLDRKKDKGAR